MSYLWRPDLANSIMFTLGSDLLDVGEGILELLGRGFEDRTFQRRHKVILVVTTTCSRHCRST
jgi:hypothetical protein